MQSGTGMSRFKTYIILMILLLGLFLPTIQILQTVSALSFWQQDSYDDFFNGTRDNVSLIGEGLDSELRLMQNSTVSWFDLDPVVEPPTRRGHRISMIYGTDKLLMFGGRNESEILLNDTWIYDLSENEWTEMIMNNAPIGRDTFGFSPIWGTDKVVLFGGQYYNYTQGRWLYLNDTWVFDLSSNSWIKKHPFTSPERRAGHSMTFVHGDDKVILFAGAIPNSILVQDTWVYDLSDNTWTEKNTLLKPPRRVEHYVTSVYNDDKIVLFGGSTLPPNNIWYNDTWVYDLSENQWILGNPSIRPSNRYRFGMTTMFDTDKVLLFGGSGAGVGYTDTWVYDVSDDTWKLKYPSIKPNYRSAHTLTAVYNMKKAILFGGWLPGGNNTNDTWLADTSLFYESQGTFISTPQYIGITSTIRSISWDSNLPSGTNVKFQIRSSATQVGLEIKDFRGPDGSINTYYTTSGTSIWSGHLGDRWLQYKVYLSTTDNSITPVLNNVTLTYNRWPEANLISPANETISSNNKPLFTWIFNDSDSNQQTEFQVVISNDSSFNSINYDSGEQSSSINQWQFPLGTSYLELPDGVWYWEVRTKDDDGDWGVYSEPFKLVIDTSAPRSNITIPVNNGYYDYLNTISGTGVESIFGAGINKVELQIKRLTDNYNWDGNTWSTMDVWLYTEGTTNWRYSASKVSWESGKKYSVQSRAIDNLSNVELPIDFTVFGFDRDPPRSWVNFPPDESFLNELNVINGFAEDINGSGLNKVNISIRNEAKEFWDGATWNKVFTLLPTIGTYNWTYDVSSIPWVTDTSYIIYSIATDNLDNVEQPEISTNFMYDNKPPGNLSIALNTKVLIKKDLVMILSLNAIDTGSGLFQMSFSENGATWTNWEPFSKEKSYNLSSKDDEVTIHFRVRDYANNTAEPIFLTISSNTISLLLDSDNDNIPDNDDAFPDDPAASIDNDGDGYPDEWNPGMSENNSTTGLQLDRYLNDFDNDGVSDSIDKFPDDPAASIDSDGDNYPDSWNPGKTEKDSTTNLTLDAYPDDPDRWKKVPKEDLFNFWIIIVIIIIILLLIIAKLTSIVRRNKRMRKDLPYLENPTLRKVRAEILKGKDTSIIELSRDNIANLLDQKYKKGELTGDTYQFIAVEFLESQQQKLNPEPNFKFNNA